MERLLKPVNIADRIKAWNKLKEMENACVLTCVIGKRTSGSFGKGCAATSAARAVMACSKCPAEPGKGKRATPRPCAVLILLNGQTTLGYLPLPAHLRAGREWREDKY